MNSGYLNEPVMKQILSGLLEGDLAMTEKQGSI
jgi:hypothetical protein